MTSACSRWSQPPKTAISNWNRDARSLRHCCRSIGGTLRPWGSAILWARRRAIGGTNPGGRIAGHLRGTARSPACARNDSRDKRRWEVNGRLTDLVIVCVVAAPRFNSPCVSLTIWTLTVVRPRRADALLHPAGQ